jgi:hypothetical protein
VWAVSQAKFNLEVGTEEEGEGEPALWWIPVTYQHVGEEQAKTTFWLSERSAEMAAPASLADNAFVFNVGEIAEKLYIFCIPFFTQIKLKNVHLYTKICFNDFRAPFQDNLYNSIASFSILNNAI